jgi:hypothetical protein
MTTRLNLFLLAVISIAIPRNAVANWKILESSDDHFGHRHAQYLVDETANKWKAILIDGKGSTEIERGTGVPDTVWIEWSPDDKKVLFEPHLSKSFIWNVDRSTIVDLNSILLRAGLPKEIDTISADWLSPYSLDLTIWYNGNQTGEKWFLNLKRLIATRLSGLSSDASPEVAMCWKAKCGDYSAFEKLTNDDEDDRMLYISVGKLDRPILLDDRYVNVSWSDSCNSLIINDGAGSNIAYTFLIPNVAEVQGSVAGNPSEVRGMRNFSDDLWKQLPSYDWLQDFDHIYYEAEWLDPTRMVVSVSGHTSFMPSEKKTNRSLKSLYFYWYLDGTVKLMAKEIFDQE